jgi:hypothetical protein
MPTPGSRLLLALGYYALSLAVRPRNAGGA